LLQVHDQVLWGVLQHRGDGHGWHLQQSQQLSLQRIDAREVKCLLEILVREQRVVDFGTEHEAAWLLLEILQQWSERCEVAVVKGEGGGSVKERAHVLQPAVLNHSTHDPILGDLELHWGQLLSQLQPLTRIQVVGLEHEHGPVGKDSAVHFCQIQLAFR